MGVFVVYFVFLLFIFCLFFFFFFFFKQKTAYEIGRVTGVQTCALPILLLHLWCNFSGVHVLAHVDWLDEKDRLVRKEIARATWQPPEVSERLVVEWAERALRAWRSEERRVGKECRAGGGEDDEEKEKRR